MVANQLHQKHPNQKSKETQMKNLLIITLAMFAFSVQAAEIKRVCREEVKKGKTVQVCKDIKVHKKLEGKLVPKSTKEK
jgi:hypothetical protein